MDGPPLTAMLAQWRGYFDDIEFDASALAEHAKDYPQLLGMIEGVRNVAAQAKHSMDAYIATQGHSQNTSEAK